MVYRAFLDPNKPCFLQELYFLPIDNLQNERSLFEVYIDIGLKVNKE